VFEPRPLGTKQKSLAAELFTHVLMYNIHKSFCTILKNSKEKEKNAA
jgi:hypothetical protein